MTKEEKELLLEYFGGNNKTKHLLVRRVSKSRGRYKNAIYIYSQNGLEDKRVFPYPFLKEMKNGRYYSLDEVLNKETKWKNTLKSITK